MLGWEAMRCARAAAIREALDGKSDTLGANHCPWVGDADLGAVEVGAPTSRLAIAIADGRRIRFGPKATGAWPRWGSVTRPSRTPCGRRG